MAHLVASTTLTDAWCRGLAHLVAHGGEAYDLLVETADPSPERGDARVYETLDAFLAVGLMQSVTTVANTIFPYGLSRSCGGREELYRRYGQLLRRLHRLGANRHGLYFERLTAYPLQGDDPRKANQLELMIARLQDELSRSGGLREDGGDLGEESHDRLGDALRGTRQGWFAGESRRGGLSVRAHRWRSHRHDRADGGVLPDRQRKVHDSALGQCVKQCPRALLRGHGRP